MCLIDWLFCLFFTSVCIYHRTKYPLVVTVSFSYTTNSHLIYLSNTVSLLLFGVPLHFHTFTRWVLLYLLRVSVLQLTSLHILPVFIRLEWVLLSPFYNRWKLRSITDLPYTRSEGPMNIRLTTKAPTLCIHF